MKQNMGTIDKVARIAIALVIFGLYFANVISGTFAIILLILAIIFIITGVFRFCPLYLPLGIRTNKKEN